MFNRVQGALLSALRKAIGRIARAFTIGLIVGALLTEAAGFLFDGGWPIRFFVHLMALAVALLLGYALAATMTIFEGVRALRGLAGELDTVVTGAMRGPATGGYTTFDRVVDADNGGARRA